MRVPRPLFPVLALFLFLAGSALAADPSAPQPAGPQALFTETTFKAPQVVEGVEIIHDFPVKNLGNEPLRILKVQTT